MKTSSTWARAFTAGLLLIAWAWVGQTRAQAAPASVDRVAVVGSAEGVGIQIDTNGPVTTEAQILTNPDRLVIDFPGALPGKALRSLRLNQGEIRAIRAGLWHSDPPVTRVVIDLSAATSYRLQPADDAILVILGAPVQASAETAPAVSIERHPTPRALAALARSPEAPLRVGFDRGLLTISAKKATLADVLYQVHLRTGAEIPIPSGAEQEQVAIQAGPAPPKDVIAALLNGSRFNYVLQGTPQDPQGVGALILTPKSNVSEQSYTPPVAPPPQQPVETSQAPVVPATQPNASMQADPQLQATPEVPPNPEIPANPEEPPNVEDPQE